MTFPSCTFQLLSALLLICLTSTVSLQTILVVYDEKSSELQTLVDHFKSQIQVSHLTINHSDIFPLINTVCTESGLWSAILDLTRTRHCGIGTLAMASGIVYMSVSDEPCHLDREDIYLSIVPPDQMYLDALISTAINNINISSYNIAVFYDHSFSGVIPTVFRGDKDVFYYLVEMSSDERLLAGQLQNIRKDMSARVFIVLATFKNAEKLLQRAHEKEMTASYYYWLAVTKTVVKVDKVETFCPQCQTAIAFTHMLDVDDLRYVLTPSVFETYAAKDMDIVIKIYDSFKILEKFLTEEKLAPKPIDCSATDKPTATSPFSNFASYLKQKHQGVIHPVGVDPESNKPWLYLDINKLDSDDSQLVGQWNNEGVTAYQGPLFPNKAEWPKLRILTIPETPFVIKKEENGEVKYEGYAISVLEAVAKAVKFRYDIIEPVNKTFGGITENGTWTGIIGELVAGRADMIVATLAVSLEWDTVIDFTIPYYDYAGIQILTKVTTQESDLFRFINVFNGRVWGTVFATLFIMTILIYLFDKYSPFSYQNCKEAYPDGGKVFTIKESAWFVMGSFTKSGEGDTPKSFSSRVLVAGFWFFCTVMMATYTANLAAFLTVSRMQTSISDLDSLLAQSKVAYSFVRDSLTEDYFRHMRSIERDFYLRWKEMSLGSIYSSTSNQSSQFAVWDYPLGDKFTNMWEKIQTTGVLNSSADGVAKVLQGDFAFIHSSPVLHYYTAKHCDLTVVGDQFSTKPYAFALQENSPLVSLIDQEILNLQGERILENLKTKWWTSGAVKCPRITTDSSSGITLSTVGGVFIFLAIGVAVCLLILATEMMMSNIYNRVAEQKANKRRQPDVIG